MRHVEGDRLRHRLRVGADIIVVRGVVGLHRAAPAGADWIDQHEIGKIEPAMRVIDELRIGAVAAIGPEVEYLRPHKAEMQEGGSRTRPAIEGEGDRPVRPGILGNIGGVEDRSVLPAILTEEIKCACRGRIGDLASIGRRQLVLGNGIAWQQLEDALSGRTLCCRGTAFASLLRKGEGGCERSGQRGEQKQGSEAQGFSSGGPECG